jgi:hypothetical protein
MKQYILVFSMAFLCTGAFAQNNKVSKDIILNAPSPTSRTTGNQAPTKGKVQAPEVAKTPSDPNAKPKLEKRTATVVKRVGTSQGSSGLRADNSPSETTELSIESVDNTLTISNFTAAHTNMEVYKIRGDGGWTQIFSCTDNCGEQATVKVEAQKKYKIHVKMFDADWKLISEKTIQHTASGETTDTETPPSCDNITVSGDENGLSVANIKAPHSHVDIYKVRADGGWETIFTCNDNCPETITVAKANAKYKHIVHVKLFGEDWKLVSEKKIEYNPE